MRGAKPPNVIALRPASATAAALRAVSVSARVRTLRPKYLAGELRSEFTRVATLLGAAGRLEARYVDCIVEYARLSIRLRDYNVALDALDDTTITTTGRHGVQVKTHPFVHLRIDAFRQWHALARELGLGPRSDRHMHAAPDLGGDTDEHFPEG